ncbi:hypothetical protein [Sinomonas halotolerans]|uniref:Lipoprotein LpqB N-terminal domain-containing protein n=1 Tax=Sinomonas halotolerans TaxID=1644133 RepID=A0ABU9X1N7_9MICC
MDGKGTAGNGPTGSGTPNGPEARGPHRRSGPGRTLIAVLAAIGVLVAVSLVLVLARGAPEAMDPSSPEGVVQDYSQAVIDGDTDRASSLLSERLKDLCGSSSGYYTSSEYLEGLRIELLSSAARDQTATVKVAVVQTSPGGIFGPSEYSTESSFQLVRDDGEWRIDTVPPMILMCQGKEPAS